MRVQKKDTKLFFDSLKHIKNNLSNMIYYEIFTLKDCDDLNQYLQIKPVNYKSKIQDMRKFGLINYKNLRDNYYEFTDYGLIVLDLLKNVGISYKNYNHEERLNSIDYDVIISKIGYSNATKLQKTLLKMLFSYYDSADSLRPYYLLFRTLSIYKGFELTESLFLDTLSQLKLDILSNSSIVKNKFFSLSCKLQEEICRPKSYIKDVFNVTGFIDKNSIIQLGIDDVLRINNRLSLRINDEIERPTKGRPTDEQSRFREEVLKAYNYKCAITGKCIAIKQCDESYNYMIDAANIIPFSDGGSFSVTNGIALSREMHRLFDKNLIAFDYNDNNQLEVIVTDNDHVIDDGTLKSINHKIITTPDQMCRPSEEALLYRIKKLL